MTQRLLTRIVARPKHASTVIVSSLDTESRGRGKSGGGEREGVLLDRPNSRSGHSRREICGLPKAVRRKRKTAMTSSAYCVLSSMPLVMHLLPSTSPMPSLVNSWGLLVWHIFIYYFLPPLLVSSMFLLFMSFLSFPCFFVSAFLCFLSSILL